MRRISMLLVGVASAAALSAQAAHATPITFTGSVIGSGFLGAEAFTDALVTFTGVGDTDDIVGGFQINHLPLEVTVAGLGGASVTDDVGVVAAPSPNDNLGFGDFSTGHGLLFIHADYGAFALATDFSETGLAFVNPGSAIGTSAGDFSFTRAAETGTFTAQLGGVPEPASWALMIAGFGLTGAALRRRRAAFA